MLHFTSQSVEGNFGVRWNSFCLKGKEKFMIKYTIYHIVSVPTKKSRDQALNMAAEDEDSIKQSWVFIEVVLVL